MILIADSGSTKTDWRLIDEHKRIHQFGTQGLNPYFQGAEQITSILQKELTPALPKLSDTEIFFYGAGCGASKGKEIVREALRICFPDATIHVEADLLGAARSLCGTQAGLAAILGTGANTCYFDGTNIIENRPALGFILGDEGSGAHIGKTLVKNILEGNFSEGISKRFFDRFETSREQILDSVYRQPLPNRYLAAFSKFAYQNLKDESVYEMVVDCFTQFFDRQICKYSNHKELPLHLTGSVAFYYSNIIRGIALRKNVNMGTITETPIAGLTLFHLGEEQ
jgi:N-acetylglucosamine kinase-like BadF-type ATPase